MYCVLYWPEKCGVIQVSAHSNCKCLMTKRAKFNLGQDLFFCFIMFPSLDTTDAPG